jgi:hypothetical protein
MANHILVRYPVIEMIDTMTSIRWFLASTASKAHTGMMVVEYIGPGTVWKRELRSYRFATMLWRNLLPYGSQGHHAQPYSGEQRIQGVIESDY